MVLKRFHLGTQEVNDFGLIGYGKGVLKVSIIAAISDTCLSIRLRIRFEFSTDALSNSAISMTRCPSGLVLKESLPSLQYRLRVETDLPVSLTASEIKILDIWVCSYREYQ